MKRLLLPLVLFVLGIGGGVGAGLFLAPADAADTASGDAEDAAGQGDPADDAAAEARDLVGESGYVKLSNQFVVPVVEEARVSALVVMGLSVEVPEPMRDAVFLHEPKLRDAFLQAMFDHANIGGFDGNFTSSSNMRVLREALREAARGVLGASVADVLIVDFVRQDV